MSWLNFADNSIYFICCFCFVFGVRVHMHFTTRSQNNQCEPVRLLFVHECEELTSHGAWTVCLAHLFKLPVMFSLLTRSLRLITPFFRFIFPKYESVCVCVSASSISIAFNFIISYFASSSETHALLKLLLFAFHVVRKLIFFNIQHSQCFSKLCALYSVHFYYFVEYKTDPTSILTACVKITDTKQLPKWVHDDSLDSVDAMTNAMICLHIFRWTVKSERGRRWRRPHKATKPVWNAYTQQTVCRASHITQKPITRPNKARPNTFLSHTISAFGSGFFFDSHAFRTRTKTNGRFIPEQ